MAKRRIGNREGAADATAEDQPPEAPSGVLSAAFGLVVDAVTAEVTGAFKTAGVRSILLRGPALIHSLYEGWARPYGDIDLLVAPNDLACAEEILCELGFEPPSDIVHQRPPHAVTWRRNQTTRVDLHRTLVGIAGPDAEVWELLSQRTKLICVGGIDVEMVSEPARALQVALHAAQHGARVEKPLEDLGRALDRLPDGVWEEAASLAERLEATEAFSTGLRLVPAGKALANRLHLPHRKSAEIALRARTPKPVSRGIARLSRTAGPRAKARLIARELVPEVEFMRLRSPLARRGRLGLLATYLWRIPWLLWHAGPALRAWRLAKKESRSA